MRDFSSFVSEGFEPTADAIRVLGRWLERRVEDRFGISMKGTKFVDVADLPSMKETPGVPGMTGQRFLDFIKSQNKRGVAHPPNFPNEPVFPAFCLTNTPHTVFINSEYGGYRNNIGFMKFAIAHEIGHWIHDYYQENGELPKNFSYVEKVGDREISHNKSMWQNVGSWKYKNTVENLADAFGRYLAGEKLNEKERLAMERITGRIIREADCTEILGLLLEAKRPATSSADFRFEVDAPHGETVREVLDLIKSGNQTTVSESSIMRCALACECWMVDELVGFAAIKTPDPIYVRNVFDQASVEGSQGFRFEFGYAIVREDVRGRYSGIGRRMFQELVDSARFRTVPMYATTRTDNHPMQRILSSSGFEQAGSAFQSIIDPSKRVALWVRAP